MNADERERFGAFEPIRVLGRGGMGTVELVSRREGDFRREYALKRLRPELEEDSVARNAFLDEGRIMGLLHHPNIVRVFDVGQDAAGPYMVLEYVDGMALGALIRACRAAGTSIPLSVILEIMRDVTRGLRVAHEACDLRGTPLNLLHRDISPDNILVGRDGVARLTDFGIAKALGRQSASTRDILKGKLGYMAPEQLRFASPGRAADLWSLGVVLFEALTERRLYSGDDVPQRILHEPAPDPLDYAPEAPPKLVELILALLAKEPEARPASAAVVLNALESILAELTIDQEDPGLAIDFVPKAMA